MLIMIGDRKVDIPSYTVTVAEENDELRDALEWLVDAFTQGDSRWHDVPCIENARKLLYK